MQSGNLKQAWTLDDLARLCDIDPAGLSETVERFNEHARNGVDPDYGRGESAYNRALGDPNHRVHPCLGPSTSRRTTPSRWCRATSARVVGSSPTSTPG